MHALLTLVWSVCAPVRSTDEARLQRMAGAVRTLLECMVGAEDVEREGLRATPMRMAKALLYFTKGYKQSLEVGDGVERALR
jgi:GTP cyclohydrolase I